MDHINFFTIFLLYLQNVSMYMYIICTLNTVCFMQCILMKHSPLAWFHMLTVLQLPRNTKCGGRNGYAWKCFASDFTSKRYLWATHDRGKAGFVTFLSLPLLPVLSCGSWLCADLGHWCEVPRMASEKQGAHSIPGLSGLEGTSADRLFQAPHQGRVISSRWHRLGLERLRRGRVPTHTSQGSLAHSR